MEKYDEIIDCPRSGGNLCYRVQVTPEISTYLSLSCGFYSNSLMKPGHEFYEETVKALPELHKDLLWVDAKTGLVWVPNTINDTENGMVFASGTDVKNWGWLAVKSIKIPEEERINHPIIGKEGEFLEYRMDMKNSEKFHENDYIEALSFIGILPE
jgi:hypothetical protein